MSLRSIKVLFLGMAFSFFVVACKSSERHVVENAPSDKLIERACEFVETIDSFDRQNLNKQFALAASYSIGAANQLVHELKQSADETNATSTMVYDKSKVSLERRPVTLTVEVLIPGARSRFIGENKLAIEEVIYHVTLVPRSEAQENFAVSHFDINRQYRNPTDEVLFQRIKSSQEALQLKIQRLAEEAQEQEIQKVIAERKMNRGK